MPATLLISLKLILFAMEMEDKKKTPLLQNSQGNTAHFPQKKTRFLVQLLIRLGLI